MKKKYSRCMFVPLVLAVWAGPGRCGYFPDGAFSDSARGTTAAQFLKVPPSARFAALGGAGLALKGPDAFFLNPAGLASYGRKERAFFFSYETLLEQSSRTGLVFLKGSSVGVFSLGLMYNNTGTGLEALDSAGRSSGAGIAAYDAALGAGWARSSQRVDFAVNAKYLKSRLAEVSGDSAAFDAGILIKAGRGSITDVGLAVRNFGPPMKLGSERAPLPFEAAGGLRWKYSPVFNMLIEGRLPVDHAAYLILAGEWFISYLPSSGRTQQRSGFFIRSGMNFKNYDDLGFMGAFTGGFGLRAGGLFFDYAFSPYGELGAAHRFTAGWGWGAAADKTASRPAPKRLPVTRRKEGVIVAPFARGGGVTATEADVIRNLVESELLKTGKFVTVERSSRGFILKEKQLVASDQEGEALAADLGRFFKAESAVSGTIYKDKKGYNITVRLVDSASEEVLRSAGVQLREDFLFRDAARRIAEVLSAVPDGD